MYFILNDFPEFLLYFAAFRLFILFCRFNRIDRTKWNKTKFQMYIYVTENKKKTSSIKSNEWQNKNTKITVFQKFLYFFIILSKPHLNNDAIIFKGNVFTFATKIATCKIYIKFLNLKKISKYMNSIHTLYQGQKIQRHSYCAKIEAIYKNGTQRK